MRFEIWESKKSEKSVLGFISKESANNQVKIIKKLKKFEEYAEEALYQKEYIKPMAPYDGLYEVRVWVCKIKYRILGVIQSRVFYLLHMFVKKTKKTPIKEIKIALSKKIEFEDQFIKHDIK